jgi:hypothetical protein
VVEWGCSWASESPRSLRRAPFRIFSVESVFYSGYRFDILLQKLHCDRIGVEADSPMRHIIRTVFRPTAYQASPRGTSTLAVGSRTED